MEFFHEPKIDWMGKKWYFIVLSLILLGAGIAAVVAHGGLLYGIDFRGGTLVYVKFAKPPSLDGIRAELRRQNLGEATIQRFGPVGDNEVIIGLGLKEASSSEALDAGKRAIVTALGGVYGAGPAGKLDFNNASPRAVSEHLIAVDPLRLASQGSEEATARYRELSEAIVNFRNSPPQSGLLSDFPQLRAVDGVTPAVVETLAKGFYLSSYAVRNTEIVGPKVGGDLRRQALYVTLAGLGAMLVYIWIRFELIYGIAAVIAVFHDVLITIGIFSLLKEEISLTVIAAILTLVGYSMNDTIVIFDRVRENIHLTKRENFVDLVNRSINQTLSRTVLTSGLTFLAVLSLYLFGGEVIHGFALALVVGVIIGTYSTIAIASPLLVAFQQRFGKVGVGEKPRVYERQAAGARR
ncbi:MAG: protein translocase subunit SecF [Acidobacteria bacterium]|nr:protein translocase subunit SecF [Acidobacteriota bacterium]